MNKGDIITISTFHPSFGEIEFNVPQEGFDFEKGNAELVTFTLTDLNGNKSTVEKLMTDTEFKQFVEENKINEISSNL